MNTDALQKTLGEAVKQTSALRKYIRDLEKHIADLESEPEMDKKVIAELHQANDQLEARLDAIEPAAVAARIHDFLFHREIIDDPWKLASSAWRRDLTTATAQILRCKAD
jgi:chromosome segregation ATPase